MAFYVGQKVVCVNDRHIMKDKLAAKLWITKGGIYIIRAVGECPYEPWRAHGLAVWLEGITRVDPTYGDFPFEAHRFRPVVERKTDIGIFTALLNPANHKHLEGV